MGDEFYSILKLMSGEEIFALVSVDETGEDVMILLQNPLVMKMMNSPKGEFIKVRKWIELSDDDIFLMKYDKILTMTECRDEKLIAIYNNYCDEDNDGDEPIEIFTESGKVKLTNKMGYVSSVEDARKKFEELYKINQEPKET
tara:strand:+ start:54 stop:482 length:429 start_codon:yes stop_codon:yes gene_type:complete